MQISNDKLPAEPNRFHQHDWGLPLLVNGTTLLVQGEATKSPCVLVLDAGSPERVASKDLKE